MKKFLILLTLCVCISLAFLLPNTSSLQQVYAENISHTEIVESSTYSSNIEVTGSASATSGVLGDITETFEITIDNTYTNIEYEWHLKFPNQISYEKQDETTSLFELNIDDSSEKYIPGIYNIACKSTIIIDEENNTTQEDITYFTFTATAKSVPSTHEFKITAEKVETDGIQQYKLTLDGSDFYNLSDLVWKVDGNYFASGTNSILFSSTLAGEHFVQVYENGSNKPLAVLAEPIVVEGGAANLTWLYVTLGVVTLIAVCAMLIVLSNKAREKIW